MLKMHFAYFEESPIANQNAQNLVRIFVPTTLKHDDFVAQGERPL
jgi:hypothetical protein